ncbi:MAG TPA: DUF4194 domain-containing protein [Bacillota bacterium]|nr:DUF4194 domain-containing protein [Bacillota bacterium]HPF42511.1 DUF4194 domain-containing protein [Bacillota bacterium]HPJ85985.1 DUF4194 domain-containing protein [Bacillota bacterium]HPQ61994.1 DUF4194 domain-containing protein [Bacillota bacterium]HRX91852.1 DUF4194 domain-containing protein [Candidatus Izemoplasmatales bacterium]
MILENYENLNQGQKQMFSDTVNKLLSTGFLARDKRDNKEQYYFVLSFKNYFDEYFGIINYELVLDREKGAIQLMSQENKSLLHLKREESLVLLILRILYHEHLAETSINDNVIVRIDEIHQKYDALELKKKINKTDLLRIIRFYKRYNLIEPLGDIGQGNTKVVIYPTVLLAIDTHEINDIFNLISRMNGQEGGSEDEETDEN